MVAGHRGSSAGTGSVFRGKDERRIREISRQAEGRNRDLSGADEPLPAQAGESQWRDPSSDASASTGEGAACSTVTFCGVGGTGARAKRVLQAGGRCRGAARFEQAAWTA